MSTPKFFVPPPDADEVARRLEKELKHQQEATPEPVFGSEQPEQSYKWLCELEHRKLRLQEIEVHRQRICDPDYWKREAHHLRDVLFQRIWEDLKRQHGTDGSCADDGWRRVILAIKQRLRRYGLNSEKIEESRLSIKEQSYWQPEAVCLREVSALREQEMQEHYWANDTNTQCMSSPLRSGTQQSKKTKRPRQSQRPQHGKPGSRQQQRAGGPRRSERLLRARVEKCSGKAGGTRQS